MEPQPHLQLARLVFTLGLAFGAAAAASASDRSATLEAIHNLENPRDLRRYGPCGELGAYQFRESTWRVYTDVPFSRALERSCSEVVAIRHYEWLKRGLERAHLAPTAYNIALAWNGGLSAAVRGSSPARAHDYARRAANLAASFEACSNVADAR